MRYIVPINILGLCYDYVTRGNICGLILLENYCDRWKLTVNATKTKVMIFRKGGRVNRNIRSIYKGNVLEIVSKFVAKVAIIIVLTVTGITFYSSMLLN